MQDQHHPLEPFFQQAVRNSYDGKLGLNDPDVTDYVARLLCEFSESENLYKVRDEMGRPIEELEEMMVARTRFTERLHRSMRNARCASTSATTRCLWPACIPRPWAQAPHAPPLPTLSDLIRAGKESYFIVSQFNLFEYKQEAPLFARLSDGFERCILGLTLVREELTPRRPALPPPQ